MTTDKTRITIYLADRRPLDDLTEALRRLAPLEDRGMISRSTAIESAVAVALADVQANGRQSAIYERLVTSPPTTAAQPGDLEPSQLLTDWRAAGKRLMDAMQDEVTPC